MEILIPADGIRLDGIAYTAGPMTIKNQKLMGKLIAAGATVTSRKGKEGVHYPDAVAGDAAGVAGNETDKKADDETGGTGGQGQAKLPVGVERLTPGGAGGHSGHAGRVQGAARRSRRGQ